MKRSNLSLTALFSFSLFALTAMAQQQGGPQCGQQGGHRPPPPEAVDACHNLKAGASCSFESPQGDSIQGTCFSPDEDKPLACRPTNPPPQGGREQGQRGQGQGGRSTVPWND